MADKLDLTKPVQTRDGRPVRILCTDARLGDYRRVVGLIDNNGFNDVVCVWGQDGTVYSKKIDDAVCGLINVPPKPVKYYTHVYGHPDTRPGNHLTQTTTCKEPSPTTLPLIKTIEFEV